jgi:diaminopimelate epimerase
VSAPGWPFVKGHGTGNDFVLLPDTTGRLDLTPSLVAAICDRRTGVGADGVLRVVPTADSAAAGHPPAADPGGASAPRWFMDYRNADGSLAEMCGNGARVFGRYLVDAGLVPPGRFVIDTRAGAKAVEVPAGGGDITVDMGPARIDPRGDLTVAVSDGAGPSWPAVGVDLGNPHAVAFVADLADAGRLYDPPVVRPDDAFPDGVNVEFVVERGPAHVALRVYERGSGATLSCGTGACAVFAVARRRPGADPADTWTVDVPGGRLLLRERAGGGIDLTGPAELVASGTLTPTWLEAHSS